MLAGARLCAKARRAPAANGLARDCVHKAYPNDQLAEFGAAGDARIVALMLVKLQRGGFAEAVTPLRRAVDFYRREGVGNWRRYYTEYLLGASLASSGKYTEGQDLLVSAKQSLVSYKDSIPPEYRRILDQVRQRVAKADRPRQ